MGKINVLGMSAALVASMLVSEAYAAVKVGDKAPDFSVVDSQGKTQKLSDYEGKTVVLEWTNDGCPFVKKHYSSGNMQGLQKDATGKGVVWLSVISSAEGKQGYADAARANQLSEERGAVPTAVLLDPKGNLGHLYDARTTPHMFVVDPKGKLVYAGAIDNVPSSDASDITSATNYVKVALAESTAGKPVSQPVTKPYGCSVKY